MPFFFGKSRRIVSVPTAFMLLLMFLYVHADQAHAFNFVPPKPGQPAADFTLPNPQGQRVTLSDSWRLHKNRVTIVAFYAVHCKPCIHELQFLQALKARPGKESVHVLVVIVDADHRTARAELQKHAIHLPTVWDSMQIVSKRYGMQTLPENYIIDKNGILVKKFTGYTQKISVAIEQQVRQLFN